MFLSSVGIGYLKSMFLKRKCDSAGEILLFLNGYKERVAYTSSPVSEIIREFCAAGRLRHLAFLDPWANSMARGLSPSEAFAAVTQTGIALPPESQKAFSDFTYEIGRSDRQTQERLCELYIGIFESLKRKFQEEYESKGKLYRNFGVYIGAFLAAVLF